MDEPTRRAWSSPELIVLVRSGPEEAVLDVCKNQQFQSSGPLSEHGYCMAYEPPGACTANACSADTVS